MPQRGIEGWVHPLAAVFEHAPNGMVVCDRDGRALWVNAAMCRLVGYAAEEFLALSPAQLVDEGDLPSVRDAVRSCRRNVDRLQVGARLVGRDGSRIDALLHLSVVRGAAGRAEYLVWQIEDVTDRRYRSEFERLIALLATEFINLPASEIDAGIDSALGELGRFAGVDRVFILELGEDGTTTSNTHEWVADGVASQIADLQNLPMDQFEWLDARLSKGQIINVGDVAELPEEAVSEIRYCAQMEVASGIAVPMLVGGRDAVGFLGFASSTVGRAQPDDIVTLLRIAAGMFVSAILRKRADETLRRHQAELSHALRLGTVGELATGLAHELNQPLAAINNFASGCVRLLTSDGVGTHVEAILDALRQVSEQALRAGEVIHRLRDHVRKSESRRQWRDINDLLADASTLLAGDTRLHRTEVSWFLSPRPVMVQVDAIQIEQVILNLVRNAIESTEESSEGPHGVRVTVERDAAQWVQVRVADTGKGVESERLEAVFAPFESTKAGGLGLGLSISRSIVETHGGRIWAEANADRGVTFVFSLPLAPVASVAGREGRAQRSAELRHDRSRAGSRHAGHAT